MTTASVAESPRRFLTIARSFASNDPNAKRQQYITIGFRESVDGGWVEKPKEKYPHPAMESFHAAFDAIGEYVVKYGGLSAVQSASLVVVSVVFRYAKDGQCEVVLNAARPLAGFRQPKLETIPQHAPEGDELKAIEDLEAEAVLYIDGKRGQLDLAVDGDPDDDQMRLDDN